MLRVILVLKVCVVFAFILVLVSGVGMIKAQDSNSTAPSDSTQTTASILERITREIQATDSRINTLTQQVSELRTYRVYLEGQLQLMRSIRDSVLTFDKGK